MKYRNLFIPENIFRHILLEICNYHIQPCIIRKNTQPAPPLLTPKSGKKWISDVLTAPRIQHSKSLCVSTPNMRPTLQTLFFTHDVITSSNYAYLSLQTHQLSAIRAVIGKRLTIVKLQIKCHALCTCQ